MDSTYKGGGGAPRRTGSLLCPGPWMPELSWRRGRGLNRPVRRCVSWNGGRKWIRWCLGVLVWKGRGKKRKSFRINLYDAGPAQFDCNITDTCVFLNALWQYFLARACRDTDGVLVRLILIFFPLHDFYRSSVTCTGISCIPLSFSGVFKSS